jgi:hypothetical protein
MDEYSGELVSFYQILDESAPCTVRFSSAFLLANYNAPKWQGNKGVSIPELGDEIDCQEELTLEVFRSLTFFNFLHANVQHDRSRVISKT